MTKIYDPDKVSVFVAGKEIKDFTEIETPKEFGVWPEINKGPKRISLKDLYKSFVKKLKKEHVLIERKP